MEPPPVPPEVLQKMEVMLKYPQFEATTMLKEGMVRSRVRPCVRRSLARARCVHGVALSTTRPPVPRIS